MKYIATSAAAAATLAMSSTSAIAGSVEPVAMVEPMVVEEQPMGSGSGAWIIPLIAVGLIALAISQSDDDDEIVGPPM